MLKKLSIFPHAFHQGTDLLWFLWSRRTMMASCSASAFLKKEQIYQETKGIIMIIKKQIVKPVSTGQQAIETDIWSKLKPSSNAVCAQSS